MKRLLAATLILAAAGCARTRHDPALAHADPPPQTNIQLVDAVADAQVRAGIIVQHTLYAHEFIPNGTILNDLGQRDLAILAEHYRRFPGPLNIQRGDASPDLYEQRVRHVVQALQQADIDTGWIKVTDGLPGGDGSPADRVLLVLRRSQQPPGGGTEGIWSPTGLVVSSTQTPVQAPQP